MAKPTPVCANCSREMTLDKIGVDVVLRSHAVVGDGPYQAWGGDLFSCPGCGARVVARFADAPFWEHFHDTPLARRSDAIILEAR